MKVSNCCGAWGNYDISFARNKYITHEDAELCPKCGEHCEYIEETECDHKNAYFFHDNAPKYCPDCDKYIDGNKVFNTINTENEQRTDAANRDNLSTCDS